VVRESSHTVSAPFFDAVLFDYKGTIFNDESDTAWIRAAAASIGRSLSDDDIAAILERGAKVMESRPDIRAAIDRCDTSVEVHREANLMWLRACGIDDELAMAIWARDGHPDASYPYPDAAPVLAALHRAGIRIAIVSDIHYDISDHFVRHDLDQYVDAYVLSFRYGFQKPDEEIYRTALEAIGVTRERALMVGDRASHDGIAAHYGIASYVLAGPMQTGETGSRGLDAVLRIVGVDA
jgi:putative hydrolase of the HAD superfamily